MMTPRLFAVFAFGLFASAALAQTQTPAQKQRMDRQMLKLSPQERVEQRCDARASGRIARDHSELKPDTTIAYAFADTKTGKSEIIAPGAALRSKGKWYRLAYHCRTTPDGLDIESFDYRLGAEIPRSEWEQHGLY